MKTADIEPFFATLRAPIPQPASELEYTQRVRAARRGAAVGAGHRRQRQQGDARACSRWRRHAAEDARARPDGARASTSSTIGLFRTKAKNLHRDLPHPGRAARRRGAARRARRSRRCPASAARPPTWCSTSPSANRRWRSTRTSSASPTAPASRSGSTPLEVELRLLAARARGATCVDAHHWLILHGRYVCLARRPLCEVCAVARWCDSAPPRCCGRRDGDGRPTPLAPSARAALARAPRRARAHTAARAVDDARALAADRVAVERVEPAAAAPPPGADGGAMRRRPDRRRRAAAAAALPRSLAVEDRLGIGGDTDSVDTLRHQRREVGEDVAAAAERRSRR